MTRNKFARPRLESLEERWVPATIRVVNGNLFVSNQRAALTVETTAVDGQIRITDGAQVTTVNGVGTLISITGTNLANTINLRAEAQAFPGNILINGRNGNDTINLSGTFGGNATILPGNGNDTVTSNNLDVSIGGNLTFVDTHGNNTFNLNGRNYDIGGSASLVGVGTFIMGADNTLSVGGTLNMTSTPVTTNPLTAQFNGLATNVGGSMFITARGQNDVVVITSELTVADNVSVNLGAGNNTFVLDPAAGGAGIGGRLSFLGGVGVDVVLFGAESQVFGDTTIDLGHGINTFIDTDTSLYAGNLTINGGNGQNTVIVNGMIDGNFSNTLGNGPNNFTVFTGSVAGKFRYRLGNGQNGILIIDPTVPQTVDIDAVFGTGSSTFVLGDDLTLTGVVRGTGGDYTFIQGLAELTENLLFINYP